MSAKPDRTTASAQPGDIVGDPYIGYAVVLEAFQPDQLAGFTPDGRYYSGSNAGRCALFGVPSSRELTRQAQGKARLLKLGIRGANGPTKEEQ
jgi:hypothetical protein